MNWEDAVQLMIDDPSKQDLVRQCYFDAPLMNAVQRYYESEEWASARLKIPRTGSKRALDVGAGNGLVSYALARDGWMVTALEPDASNLVGCGAIRRLADEARLSIQIIEGVTEDLPVEGNGFDAIFVRQVFHHAPDIYRFATKLAELLKPGGHLLTWRDHVISTDNDLPAFLNRHPLHSLYGGENAFKEQEYAEALTKAGLSIVGKWRHFDDPMNYGPLSPKELFSHAASRALPAFASRALGALLGNRVIFGAIAPLLSTIDTRPGRLVAFLSRKER